MQQLITASQLSIQTIEPCTNILQAPASQDIEFSNHAEFVGRYFEYLEETAEGSNLETLIGFWSQIGDHVTEILDCLVTKVETDAFGTTI